jgi:hypothetical protein
MDTVLQDGCVITGDGTTCCPRADVLVSGGQILDIDASCALHRHRDGGADIIDAAGCTIMPGIINAHAHGCILWTIHAERLCALDDSAVAYNRNRHLLQGTTTLLNVCGLAFPDEIDDEAATAHAMDIHVSTAHTENNIRAALAVDGAGLSTRHLQATTEHLLSQGAKALGEVGGGQTLGGGAQEYRFIPDAIKRQTGITILPAVARRLKNAILGAISTLRTGYRTRSSKPS